MIEPRYVFLEIADWVIVQECNIINTINRQVLVRSSGSESMACNKSLFMNVGDPIFSRLKGVSVNKCKSKEAEKEYRKSDG